MSTCFVSRCQAALRLHCCGKRAALRAQFRIALTDARGAAAVEFALVSGMLITTIMVVLVVGLYLYMGQALDHATDVAARQIMTGSAQKASLTQTTFRTSVVCAALPSVFNCNNIIINVQTITEGAQPGGYYGVVNSNQTGLNIPTLSNNAGQFNLGVQGSYVYLQVIYPITILPSFLTNIFGKTTYNGVPVYLSMSTAAFRNEQY